MYLMLVILMLIALYRVRVAAQIVKGVVGLSLRYCLVRRKPSRFADRPNNRGEPFLTMRNYQMTKKQLSQKNSLSKGQSLVVLEYGSDVDSERHYRIVHNLHGVFDKVYKRSMGPCRVCGRLAGKSSSVGVLLNEFICGLRGLDGIIPSYQANLPLYDVVKWGLLANNYTISNFVWSTLSCLMSFKCWTIAYLKEHPSLTLRQALLETNNTHLLATEFSRSDEKSLEGSSDGAAAGNVSSDDDSDSKSDDEDDAKTTIGAPASGPGSDAGSGSGSADSSGGHMSKSGDLQASRTEEKHSPETVLEELTMMVAASSEG